jgi:hypothetical protein
MELSHAAGADHARFLEVVTDVDRDLRRARSRRERQECKIGRKGAEALSVNNVIKSDIYEKSLRLCVSAAIDHQPST